MRSLLTVRADRAANAHTFTQPHRPDLRRLRDWSERDCVRNVAGHLDRLLGMRSIAFSASWLALVGLLAAGCSDAGGTQARPVTLRVHLGLFGGPMRPDGGMAASNAPQPNAPIVIIASDRIRRTSRTDARGIATFSVLPGRYIVDSPTCGHGPQRVVIHPNLVAHVEVRCDIP